MLLLSDDFDKEQMIKNLERYMLLMTSDIHATSDTKEAVVIRTTKGSYSVCCKIRYY